MFHSAHEADFAFQAISAIKAKKGVFVIYRISAVRTGYLFLLMSLHKADFLIFLAAVI